MIHGISTKTMLSAQKPKNDTPIDLSQGDNDISKNLSLSAKKQKQIKSEKSLNYYKITCKDNGCGIKPEKVGDMLGRVLSGSKHGVRQTRGKFGLGAKMVIVNNHFILTKFFTIIKFIRLLFGLKNHRAFQ